MRRGILACVLCLALGPGSGAQNPAAGLSPQERRLNQQSFEYVWTTIRDKFWDPAFGGLNWQAVHDELKPKMDAAQTMPEARAVLTEMLGRLKLTHFEIIPSDAYSDLDDVTAPRGDGETGIDLRVIGDKAVVNDVDPDSPAANASVRRGWEIERADKTELSRTIAKAGQAYQHSSLRGLVLRQALLGRLQGNIGEPIEIVFRDGAGKTVVKQVPEARPRGTLTKFGFLPAAYVWIESRRVAPGVGYIRFNMFLDPAHVMKEFGDAVEACMSCRGLIVDLRGNPGGIGAMAMGMAGWFVDRDGERLGTLYMRDGTLNFTINPRPEVYSGALAILVDSTSASTAEIFAGGLKDLKRARIFGERTAAAALPSAIEMLPNGDGFQYALANYISEGGKALEGSGVEPDVEAPWTREALLAGRDPALEAALDWIESVKKGTQ